MPSTRQPCTQCKDKHVKCDGQQPKCRRCVSRSLPCNRPAKKTVFRHGAAPRFAKDQRWVSSAAHSFRVHGRNGAALETSPSNAPSDNSPPHSPVRDTSSSRHAAASHTNATAADQSSSHYALRSPGIGARSVEKHQTLPPIKDNSNISYTPLSNPLPPILFNTPATTAVGPFISPNTRGSLNERTHGVTTPTTDESAPRRFPLENVQEACLLRYFVEEISHWFDLCDEQRHFQLVVPVRARKYPHLLDAIFAVSARHLSRVPEYKTERGILYQGQLLPHLSQHDAVEYMLRCIPALRQFQDIHDYEYLDSIIATAVILRQLEEIDDEDDTSEHSAGADHAHMHGAHRRVNFLAIIDAVLRSSSSQTLFARSSLIQAAYWMALRQEIYHSFTRKQPPTLLLAPENWQSASRANKTVMHTVQVAKWRWGDASEHEFARLAEQQRLLEREIFDELKPIYERPAQKAAGEIFPIVWYSSNIEVITNLLCIISKSVLVAEDPSLRLPSTPRSSWRKVESEVRRLLLRLCGIALCHPACPPALVNAAIGIQLYEDFFTDEYERQSLRGVVERYRDAHAWPVTRLLEMFR